MQNMPQGFMHHDGQGFMGGYGPGQIISILLVIVLIVAIVKVVQKQSSGRLIGSASQSTIQRNGR